MKYEFEHGDYLITYHAAGNEVDTVEAYKDELRVTYFPEMWKLAQADYMANHYEPSSREDYMADIADFNHSDRY